MKKETLAQVFFYEFCETSKNTFYYRTPLVAASNFVLKLHVKSTFAYILWAPGYEPPSLKKLPPSFWLNPAPPPPLKIRNRSSPPPFAPTHLFMRKLLVSPSFFFTKSCFMKPIVRYHEIIVFHQDLATAGSSDKKMLVFFFISYHYRINVKIGFNW